jgi:hypothetical protein
LAPSGEIGPYEGIPFVCPLLPLNGGHLVIPFPLGIKEWDTTFASTLLIGFPKLEARKNKASVFPVNFFLQNLFW